jgi:alkyl sulfatase BDS1-like metallo-beta-lactamase superfamily hydrolase
VVGGAPGGERLRAMNRDLPFADRQDFEDADRGLIDKLDPAVITNADGRVVWDNDAYAFLDGDCPDTAHPSLWRQGQLVARQGLFEVTKGIYQLRGFDLSNMTVIEGDSGVIIIDPLISTECAAAGLAMYRKHRGDRPVAAVIYTHSHIDHFGGVRGVVTDDVPIVAPEGFLEHAVAENVYAGTAMSRRAIFMYGSLLEKSPSGQIGTGLGMTTSAGSVSLIPPTLEITQTGQEEVFDGVRVQFQMTPGTEAPSEMNFYFPDFNALCMAENATHNLHNLLTLRGALVRDPRTWSRYLDEAIRLFTSDADVAFASHHWPTWGRDRIVTYLTQQRDLYGYLHDQTLRLINKGYTGIEIAEDLELPPSLDRAWHTHGYYGSVSHNVKAVYQRYLGWFDGNPANLWQHPPEGRARRYVESMGGSDAVVATAQRYVDEADLRFAVELLNHVMFAEPDHTAGRELLAAAYTSLGHGAENGTWRNFYLNGAKELRTGIEEQALSIAPRDMLSSLTVEQIFDSVAIRIDGPKAWDEHFVIDWHITDIDERWRTTMSNGVFVPEKDPLPAEVDMGLSLTKPQLLLLLVGQGIEEIDMMGDLSVLGRLVDVVDTVDRNFPIVTP